MFRIRLAMLHQTVNGTAGAIGESLGIAACWACTVSSTIVWEESEFLLLHELVIELAASSDLGTVVVGLDDPIHLV